MAAAFNGGLPPTEALLVEKLAIAERTGWTLREIDDMDVVEFHQAVEIYGALDKARNFAQRPRGGGGKRR